VSGKATLSAENSEKSLGGQGSAPNHNGRSQPSPRPVMWSETVGLRTRRVWNQTRSSADADNGLNAFSCQSRSTNMVPVWVHCDFLL